MEKDELDRAVAEFRTGISYVVNRLAPAADREDILQDCLIRAIENISDCHVDRKSWAARIARNEIYNRRRRAAVHARAVDRLRRSGARREDTLSDRERRELAQDLDRASRTLTWRQWQVWTLVDLMDYRYAEAAELIGERPNNVKILLSRAHDKLREALLRLWLLAG